MSTPFWYNALLAVAKPIYRWKIKQKAENAQQFELEIRQRFGSFLPVKNKHALWFHAVSVGETNAVQALVEHYLAQGQPVLMTNTTKTGQARAKQLFEHKYPQLFQAVFLPVDQKSVINAFLDKYQPKLLALVETELWANLLHEVRKRHIPSVLVNARLSEKSASRYAKYPSLTTPMLQQLNAIFAQNIETKQRFIQLGMAEDKIQVLGNLKFDMMVPEHFIHQAKVLQQEWQLNQRTIFTLASTHAPEEYEILKQFQKYLHQHQNLLAIVVPRHPERFEEVYQQSIALGLRTHRRSLGEPIQPDTQVYLADTMGELWLWYALSRSCFVGGSLNEVGGGHNILEPMKLGVATITGAKYFNFQHIVDELIDKKAIRIAHDFTQAVQFLQQDLSDGQQASQRAGHANQVLKNNQGALKWHIYNIDQLLKVATDW